MGDTDSGGEEKLTRLLPVELGRLVYTYLGEVKCMKTRDVFVHEYPDLKELSSLVDKKLLRTLDMDLYGHNLEDAIKEYMLIRFGIDRLCKTILPANLPFRNMTPIQKLKCISDFFKTIKCSPGKKNDLRLAKRPHRLTLSQSVQEEHNHSRRVDTLLQHHIRQQPHDKAIDSTMTTITLERLKQQSSAHQGSVLSKESSTFKTLSNSSAKRSNESGEVEQETSGDNFEPPRKMTASNVVSVEAKVDCLGAPSRDVTMIMQPSPSNTATVDKSEQQGATYSPLKSRKSQKLKSKAPVKNPHPGLSMPIFFTDKEAEMAKKIESFTQFSTDDVMNDVIAKPIADILAETRNGVLVSTNVEVVVENFLSNSELFDSFNQVLEEVATHGHNISASIAEKGRSEDGKALTMVTLSSPSNETMTLNFVNGDQQLLQQQLGGKSSVQQQSKQQKHAHHREPESNQQRALRMKSYSTQKRQKKGKIRNGRKLSLDLLSAGFSAKLGIVLNAEVNGYGLVNHLYDLENKSTLHLLQDFLATEIETLNGPLTNEMLQQVMTESSSTVFDPKQISPCLSLSSSTFAAVQSGEASQFGKHQDVLTTPIVSKNSLLSNSCHQSLPTSFLNILEKSSPIKISRAGIPHFQDLKTPVKALNVDVTPSKQSQDEESLTTPPSEGYFESSKTPAKNHIPALAAPSPSCPSTNFANILKISKEKTPLKCQQVGKTPAFGTIEEEDPLMTPPSEQYANVTDNVDKVNIIVMKTPCKNEINDHVMCTPLKALKEAVRLATPSPVKRTFPIHQHTIMASHNTPLKSLAAAAQFTPSPCKRPPTTPAKWYTPQYNKPTPLKGLDEALSRMAQYSPQTPLKDCTPLKQRVIVFSAKKSEKKGDTSPRQSLRRSPMKRDVSEVAKQLFGKSRAASDILKVDAKCDFVSPSKRVPRRIKSVRIAERLEKVEPHGFSSWERQHDANNLDYHRKVESQVESQKLKKRSRNSSADKSHSQIKKLRTDEKVVKERSQQKSSSKQRSECFEKTSKRNGDNELPKRTSEKCDQRIDIRREIVPQLTSPSKTPLEKESNKDPRPTSLPGALGLVPRSLVSEISEKCSDIFKNQFGLAASQLQIYFYQTP